MTIKPAAGRIIRDPANAQVLPAEGREVHGNRLYWLRLLHVGDVVAAEIKPRKAKEV
ncbi:MAG: DUF2635 domain-containing protein [Magnetospirillum sp.]|nr:MAG: DUF2635 domain-containing protein [Magnetospirillum sp.]